MFEGSNVVWVAKEDDRLVGHGLQPAKAFLNPLPLVLTQA